jgi:hypothetical protein
VSRAVRISDAGFFTRVISASRNAGNQRQSIDRQAEKQGVANRAREPPPDRRNAIEALDAFYPTVDNRAEEYGAIR